jgi:hypothetical protein
METFSKIIDFLNDKFTLPLAIVCSFLLFAPDWVLAQLHLKEFASSADTLISLTFLYAAIFYLYGWGKRFGHYVESKFLLQSKRIARRRTIAAHVKGLRSEEEEWIYFCLRENVRTLHATETNDTAVSLESKTLVYRPKISYNKHSTPFSFYPEVWTFLTRKKARYCPHDRIQDPAYNEKVNKFIKHLRNES